MGIMSRESSKLCKGGIEGYFFFVFTIIYFKCELIPLTSLSNKWQEIEGKNKYIKMNC